MLFFFSLTFDSNLPIAFDLSQILFQQDLSIFSVRKVMLSSYLFVSLLSALTSIRSRECQKGNIIKYHYFLGFFVVVVVFIQQNKTCS